MMAADPPSAARASTTSSSGDSFKPPRQFKRQPYQPPPYCQTPASSPTPRPPLRVASTSQSQSYAPSPPSSVSPAPSAPFGRNNSAIQHWTRHETRICKSLSYILRHGALLKGLNMRADGYVKVSDLLKLPEFRTLGFHTLIYIVKWNMKRRFSLACQVSEDSEDLMDINPDQLLQEHDCVGAGSQSDSAEWLAQCDPTKLFIRALQGHSISIIDKSSLYQKIMSPQEIPTCVHGSYWEVWDNILRDGLMRMSRLHIHFAKGLPGDPSVVSGIRQNAQLAIYIDVPKAMADGIEFWTSHNGVILSEGINGVIPSRYFLKVLTLPSKLPVPLKPFDAPETQEVIRRQRQLQTSPSRRICSDIPLS
eukprot:Blabericola_migrator_1__10169@NODE_567_length_7556_cov_134_355722_g56_i1_p3_GENE_NODE_567_length_7556_cov_134_355722_g56_i1NODE_567_length_7556_cov_134_355722_g56_i1_p3_ORF_typecomplete_len364_score41_92PTS_2RNA/PF01885_16/1_1e60KAR9/PF08580_10/0_12_NODE_567_length_7556_cov_134_355722_g56_i124003491